jgi:hypothetical protein
MKLGNRGKAQTLDGKLELTMRVGSTHSHDAARVMKISNWVKEIWLEPRGGIGWMNYELKRWATMAESKRVVLMH